MELNFTVHKKKLYEEVVEQISRLVIEEGYKAGDRLPSLNDLSNLFHVGKPTVREALSVLTAAGFVEIRHGSGIFVRKPSEDESYSGLPSQNSVEGEKLLNWLEYRRAVEVEAAGLAAARRNDFDIKAIKQAKNSLDQETIEGKVGSYWEYEFHHRIAVAAHNPIFTQAVSTSAEILRHYFSISKHQTHAASRFEAIFYEHQEIMDAIIQGNPEEAKRAMLNHIENVRKRAKHLSKLNFDQMK